MYMCMDNNKLWKILKEMGIPDHLTCLLRNLYAGQEATVRSGHGTTDWFQMGKEHVKAVIVTLLIELIYTLNFNIPLTHPCTRLHVNLSNEFIKHT